VKNAREGKREKAGQRVYYVGGILIPRPPPPFPTWSLVRMETSLVVSAASVAPFWMLFHQSDMATADRVGEEGRGGRGGTNRRACEMKSCGSWTQDDVWTATTTTRS
jgi:hypothetical protein